MRKPTWLKKAVPNKPWKYKHIVQEGKHKGLEIEPYNFNTPVGMDINKIDEACKWIDSQMETKTPSRRDIIREYRATLDKMGIRTWAGFLDKDWWTRDHYKGDPVYGNGKYYGNQECNSRCGTCNVCGSRQWEQYVGSHFRQCFKNLEEHQKAVTIYSDLLKRVFNSILKEHGYRLKKESEESIYNPIWENARKCLRDGLYGWDKAIESIGGESE